MGQCQNTELVNYFNENEIEADNTQYEKLNFWARVRSLKEYAGLRDWTEFMIHGSHRNSITISSNWKRPARYLP